jgi:uncharacterized protein (TIGR00375 family)
MRVIADLHIHSRYSRATGKKLTPAYLDRWARIKGINLLGTGDCTHPQWLAELREQLEDREPGLYTLKEGVRAEFDAGPALSEGLPKPAGDPPRFVLTGEISTIYKKNGATRKVHHLIMLPDFKAAASFQTRLEREGGNIRSDGRPILGIDSRDLLAMLLETDDRALLIPAHIWTPWFSALGAQSGFDSIDECYGDLASRIPAVETGLSSNPPMNWALSSLDRFAVISNSDAHSPEKLGREATVFDMDLDYFSLHKALSGNRVIETIEFFPQEGKYHYDGHRKCALFLAPEEAAASGGVCPVCGKPLTRGVMGRVLELADRPVDETAPCPPEAAGPAGGRAANQRPYRSLIPLPELLGELLETGAASKKTAAVYGALIEKAGSEFALLMDMDAGALSRFRCPGLSGELLAAAVTRMRSGKVSITPGYDGEYGVIRAFPPGGAELSGGFPEFDRMPSQPGRGADKVDVHPQTRIPARAGAAAERKPAAQTAVPALPLSFAPDQEAAVSYNGSYAVIIAGPGTGKTAVLTARIERLIREGQDPASILALSFTVKAAGELRERIARAVSAEAAAGITAATFHSLCCALLREQPPGRGVPENFTVLSEAGRNGILEEILKAAPGKTALRYQGLGKYIEGRKRFLLLPGETTPALGKALPALPELAKTFGLGDADADAEILYGLYRKRLKEEALLDYDDLIAGAVRLLAGNPAVLAKYRVRYRRILVDEYQDVNFAQYVLIRLLAPTGEEAGTLVPDPQQLRVIGDPNQAIYAFRGSDKRFLDRFDQDYPGAARFFLSRSFRCADPIINAAGRLTDTRLEGTKGAVNLFRMEYPTEKSEAEGIARRISRLIGGTSFFALDSRVAGHGAGGNTAAEGLTSLGECVVLLRTTALTAPIVKALKDHGLPFEVTGDLPWWEEEPVKTVLDRLKGSPRLVGRPPAEAVRLAWDEAERDGLLKAAGKGRKKKEEAVDGARFERLLTLAGMYGNTAEFLDTLAVSGSGDGGPAEPVKREAVRVMTIHASKGLEADHVFAAGLEDGILPFTLYDGKNAAGADAAERIAEEGRLLYVAMTRARQGLYLSWARSRTLGGRKLEAGPSRFLEKLERLIPLAREEIRKPADIQGRLF